MDSTITLHELLLIKPEHPVPHPGNICNLTYPSVNGSVAVDVVTDAYGYAKFTVHAPANEVDRSIDSAERALARMASPNPQKALNTAQARVAMGAQVFDQNRDLLVRQRLLSLAVVRTGIQPFLQTEYIAGENPRKGKDFTFEASVMLRPYGELKDYGPVEVAFPPKPQVDEAQVDEKLAQMMGASIRWQDVPEDAAQGLEKLKAPLRAQLENELENKWYSDLMTLCADEMSKRLVAEPPIRFIEALRDEMASQYATAVESSGQSWNDYIKTPGFDLQVFKEQMTSEALVSLKRGLALDAVARHEGIALTEEDVIECLTNVARGHEQEAAQAMIDNGQLPQLLETALRAKTGDFIASQAKDIK